MNVGSKKQLTKRPLSEHQLGTKSRYPKNRLLDTQQVEH
jgi:hypothetical protein